MRSSPRGLTLALGYLCASAAAGAVDPLCSAITAIASVHLFDWCREVGHEATVGAFALVRGEWVHDRQALALGALHPQPAPEAPRPRPCTLTEAPGHGLSIVCDAPSPSLVPDDEGDDQRDVGRRRASSTSLGALSLSSLLALEPGQGDWRSASEGRTAELAHSGHRIVAWGVAIMLAGLALVEARRSSGAAGRVIDVVRVAEGGATEAVGEFAAGRIPVGGPNASRGSSIAPAHRAAPPPPVHFGALRPSDIPEA